MSANRHKPHLLILPEDQANREIANGFVIQFLSNRIEVRDVGKGWLRTVDKFLKEIAPSMGPFPNRFVVLLIDFDDQADRVAKVMEQIPEELCSRTFVVGSLKEAEDLKSLPSLTGSFRRVGEQVAKACVDPASSLWSSPLLKHNVDELERMRTSICELLVT